jgi:formylmethanofuran dehydrogenase subunit E|tara:strand:- start:3800 stop:3949 length:150 start_codon:yes stop_codon:yes gene_type:complete
MVINFIQNAKRNSNVKNMSKCEKCEMFFQEDEINLVDGKSICNKPACNK